MTEKRIQPTLTQAVEIIVRSSAEFARAQIAEWRGQFGDAFADQVRALALPQWQAKNRNKKKIYY
jgi:hypothetical protein